MLLEQLLTPFYASQLVSVRVCALKAAREKRVRALKAARTHRACGGARLANIARKLWASKRRWPTARSAARKAALDSSKVRELT